MGPWTDGDARRLRMSDAAKRSGSKRSEAFFCFDGLKSFVVGKQREEVFPAGQRPKMAPEVAGQTAKRPLPGGQVERLVELLPGPSSGPTVRIEGVGAAALRRFWAAMAAVDLPLWMLGEGAQTWNVQKLAALRKARHRCKMATAPFPLVLRLLEEDWAKSGQAEEEALLRAATGVLDKEERGSGSTMLGAEAVKKAREASAAAKASAQWDLLLVVQHLLGRPAREPAPTWKDMTQELHRRRERLLSQAHSFQLIAALLDSVCEVEPRGPKQLEERCCTELRRLIAVQNLIPEEWR